MTARVVELSKPVAVDYETREISNTTFVLRPDFLLPYTKGLPFDLVPRGAIWVPPGHPGLRIRGCRIIGWADRYDNRWMSSDPNWIGKDGSSRPLAECSGIHADYVEDLTVEDVEISRMPDRGIYLAAVERVSLRNVSVRRSMSAVQIDYFSPVASHSAAGRAGRFPKRPSRGVRLTNCWAIDNRGAGYGVREELYRGIYDPLETIGSSGFYCYSTLDLRMERCGVIGSCKGGAKIAHCQDVLIEDFFASSLQLVGSMYWSAERGPYQLDTVAVGTPDQPMLSRNVRVVRPTLFPRIAMVAPGWKSWPLALAMPHEDTVHIEGGHIWAHVDVGMGYAQAWEGCNLDLRGVTFHGPTPATPPPYGNGALFSTGDYGAPTSRTSSINADLLTVNEFRQD